MSFYLPFRNNPDQTQRISLDGEIYDFLFQWSAAPENAWYCSIGAVGQRPSVKFKLINGVNLLRGYKAYPNVPQGNLYVADNDEFEGRPDRNSFIEGSRFRLLYFTVDEIS